MGDKVAIIMRKAPYGSVYTAEGFRTIMGVAVFELDISVVFADDGVYALVKDQRPDKLDMKPLGDGFPMLEDFGVSKFYVHDKSLAERGLSADDLVVPAQVVSSAEVAEILEANGKVLPF